MTLLSKINKAYNVVNFHNTLWKVDTNSNFNKINNTTPNKVRAIYPCIIVVCSIFADIGFRWTQTIIKQFATKYQPNMRSCFKILFYNNVKTITYIYLNWNKNLKNGYKLNKKRTINWKTHTKNTILVKAKLKANKLKNKLKTSKKIQTKHH